MGVALPQLSIGRVRSLLVSTPEESKQIIIAEELDSLNRNEEFQWIELTKLQRLKKGLMQDLLTGKVPVEPLLA